jgi:hypothetical protein
MVILASGRAKPGSRNTCPPTIAYGSAAGLRFCPAVTVENRTAAAAIAATRVRLLFVVVLFFIVVFVVGFFIVLVEVVVILVQVVVFLAIRREFQGRDAAHVQIGAALLADERIAFVQLILFDIDCPVAEWAVDHLSSSFFPPGRRARQTLADRSATPFAE